MTTNYQDIFNISFEGLTSQEQQQATAALEEIGETTEGQVLYSLIQSNGGDVDLIFSNTGKCQTEEISDIYDIVTISLNQIKNFGYYNASGELEHYSIQGALVHELYHVVEDNILESEALDEGRATQFANEYMAKYYGEERRVVYADELLASQGLPDNANIFNTNFINPNGHSTYHFIGETGEGIESLITSIDTDEYDNNANFYFYKVIADHHGFSASSDNITTNYFYATGDEDLIAGYAPDAGVLGAYRINDDFINGFVNDDVLTTANSKVVYAFSGDDTISIVGDDRIVYGGAGNDLIIGSVLDSTVDGGIGIDTLSYVNITSAVNVDMLAGNTVLTSGGVIKDTFVNIENVTGSAYADVILGDNEINILNGGAGNDTLAGGAGNDSYLFTDSFGHDHVSDGAGSIVIDGVTLSGSAHYISDSKWQLTVGSGVFNLFHLGSDNNELLIQKNGDTSKSVIIDDFALSSTKLGISLDPMGGAVTGGVYRGALTSSGYDVSDLIIAGNGNDNIRGDSHASDFGNDTIYGLGGNDFIRPFYGNDYVDAGAGNDRVLGDGGFDTIYGGSGDDTIESINGTAEGGYMISNPDSLYGGSGNDFIYLHGGMALGDEGNDRIESATGHNKYLAGGVGNDTLIEFSASDNSYRLPSGDVVYSVSFGGSTLDGGEGIDGIEYLYNGANNNGVTQLTINLDQNYSSYHASLYTYYGQQEFHAEVTTVVLNFENAKGSYNDDTLIGNASSNSLMGWYGNDYLSGHEGNDTLEGYAGSDTLDGGAGDDRLHTNLYVNGIVYADAGIDTLIFAGTFGHDTVSGGGILQINGNHFSGDATYDSISGSLTLNGFALFQSTNGLLMNDGSGNSVLLQDWSTTTNYGITLGNSPLLLNGTSGNDTIYGATGNDILTGMAGNDRLLGDAGNDTIYANQGNDTLVGGTGNDLLYGMEGTDTLIFSGLFGNDVVSLGESIQINGSVFSGTTTYDPTFGMRVLNGYSITSMPAGILIDDRAGNTIWLQDWNASSTNYGITLGSGPLLLTGNGSNNLLSGSQYNDTIDGRSGSDTLIGGDGNDSLVGDAGNDSLMGDEGTDTISFTGNFGNDTVAGGESIIIDGAIINGSEVTLPFTYTGNGLTIGTAGKQVYLSDWTTNGDYGITLVNFQGAANADSIFGSAASERIFGLGGADTINGQDGNDTLDGGNGNDSLIGGDGTDTLLFTGTSFGNDTVAGGEIIVINGVTVTGSQSNLNFYHASSGLTVGSGSSRVYLSDWIADGDYGITRLNLQGTSGADSIVGNGADNIISGLGGADTIDGQDGNDTLDGGNGDDSLIGGTGMDTFVFFSGRFGNDTVAGGEIIVINGVSITGYESNLTFSHIGGGLTIGSGSNHVYLSDWSADGDYGISLINLQGGSGADSITGNAENNYLAGLGGADTIDGLEGDDTLDGGNGADSLIGGAGIDTFVFSGTFGNDTVAGGEIVVINGVTVTGYESTLTYSIIGGGLTIGSGSNRVYLADWSADGDYGISLIHQQGGSGADSIIGNAENNYLIGLGGADTINGLDGDDTLDGGNGNDSLIGGAGYDSIYGGAGNDTLVSNDESYDQFFGGDGFDTYKLAQVPAGTYAGSQQIEDSDGQGEIYIGDTLVTGEATYNFHTGAWELGISGEFFIFGYYGTPYLSIGHLSPDYSIGYDDVAINGFINGQYGITLAATPDTLISGTADADNITGGFGNDTLVGLDGDDNLGGNVGNDSLVGGDGNDALTGHYGADTFDGGLGIDYYYMDVDDGSVDTAIITPEAGVSEHINFGNEDKIDLSAFSGLTFSDLQIGSNRFVYIPYENSTQSLIIHSYPAVSLTGDHFIFASAPVNEILGTSGNDNLTGTASDDSITGYGGDDYVYSAEGNDTIDLGNGNDQGYGAAGNDLISGGDGNDRLGGSFGNDTIYGGSGNDTIFGQQNDDLIDGGIGYDEYRFETGPGSYWTHNHDMLVDEDGSGIIYYDVYTSPSLPSGVYPDIALTGQASSIGANLWQIYNSHITFNLGLNGTDLVITNNINASDSITIQDFTSGDLGIIL